MPINHYFIDSVDRTTPLTGTGNTASAVGGSHDLGGFAVGATQTLTFGSQIDLSHFASGDEVRMTSANGGGSVDAQITNLVGDLGQAREITFVILVGEHCNSWSTRDTFNSPFPSWDSISSAYRSIRWSTSCCSSR